MPRKTDSDQKSVDVTTGARPKAQAQSRPVVIGNRPMIDADPMVTGNTDNAPKLPGAPIVRTGKTIQRAGAHTDEPEEETTKKAETPSVIQPESEETVPVSKPKSTSDTEAVQPEASSETTAPDDTAVAKLETEHVAQKNTMAAPDVDTPADDTARQAELEALIAAGTYMAPIGTDPKSSHRRLVIGLLIVVIGVGVIGDLLLDTGIAHLSGVPHTSFFATKHDTATSTPANPTTTQKTTTTAALSADVINLTKANVTSVGAALTAFYAQNAYYPAELSATTLTQIDPTLLSPPAGVSYTYQALPAGCTTAKQNCTSFRLEAVNAASKAVITSTASTAK